MSRKQFHNFDVIAIVSLTNRNSKKFYVCCKYIKFGLIKLQLEKVVECSAPDYFILIDLKYLI